MERNKKIAKNTLTLYFRMLVQMVISFWTTREVLLNLGVTDFGLSNVIGGIVTMFAFLANIMRSSASRYFAVCIGRQDVLGLRQIFSLTFYLYLVVIAILFILLETIGLWMIESKLIIPIDRLSAAYSFYHFSVATFLINTLAVPFTSMIIAKEDMGYFAGISILESFARLAVAYAISFNTFDRLPYYGMLILAVAIVCLSLNVFTCLKNYKETFLMRYWNKSLFLEILRFAMWSIFGGLTSLFSDVLINILLNNFFGVAINAARGIAMQVYHGANTFTENFLMAVNPQIVKLYAQGALDEMFLLTVRGAKFGFILALFIVTPVSIDVDSILSFWLNDVPDMAGLFIILLMINLAIDVFSHPLITVAKATGKIALYQSVVGITIWMKFPLSYLVLKNGFSPISVFWISIFISIICLFLRLIIIRKLCFFPTIKFLKTAVFPGLLVALFTFPLSFCIHNIMPSSIFRIITVFTSNVFFVCIFSYALVMSNSEREKIKKIILQKIKGFT